MKVSGGSKGPRVRLVGGRGNDTLDASGSGNAKLSDSEGQDRAVEAQEDDRPYHPPAPPKNAPWIPPRDWTRETWGIPWISYGGDLGVFLGYGFQTEGFGFRKTPYSTAHRVRAGYSFKQESGRVDYAGAFRRENRGSFFGLAAYTSGRRGAALLRIRQRDRSHRRARGVLQGQRQPDPALSSLQVPFGSKGLFSLGPAAKYTQSDESKDQFINQDKPYGVGDFGQLALHGVLSWGNQDNQIFPRKGFLAAARGTYYLKTWTW